MNARIAEQDGKPLGTASRMWMAAIAALLLAGALWPSGARAGEQKAYPYRWFYIGKNLKDGAAAAYLEKLVDTAAAHGLNGMLLDAGMTGMDLWEAAKLDRMKKLKAHCDEKKVELIPLILSAGYGGGTLVHDRNLAAGLPVKGVLFRVKHGEANVVSDSPLPLALGGFEKHQGDKVSGFDFQDAPGKATFIDAAVAKEGKVSLRMENFAGNKGRVRLKKRLTQPYRHYVVRFWAKASGLRPSNVSVCIYTEKGSQNRSNFKLPDGGGWRKIELSVCTLDFKYTDVWVGAWGVKAGNGKLWIDGLEIFEPGLVNVLRRPGTPLRVKQDGGDEVYREGVDYGKVVDKGLRSSQAYHAPPAIKILPGGKIKDGARLRVSYYTPPFVKRGQQVVCLSAPKVYAVWRKAIAKINETIHPKIWFLDMDEIRGGSTCAACRNRKNPDGSPMTPGAILGSAITRQVKLIRDVAPKAEVAIWSDMLDPNHNARANYFTVPDGGYAGSWKHIPKDLIIGCWYLEKAEKSLPHFSGLGFRTLAAAYYDADDLGGCKRWLKQLAQTPKAAGIMYTSWEHKYKLLAPFGDLVSRR